MIKNDIFNYVKTCVADYESFVGIEKLPVFTVKSKEMTLEKSQQQGFDAPATVFYDIPTGGHTLEIWSKLSLNKEPCKCQQ